MRRRSFLQLTAASGAAVAAAPFDLAAAGGPAAASLVVTDISATVDAANLSAVLQTFLANGMTVTCAVQPPGDALDGLAGILQDLVGLGPGVEIALDLPDLAALSPHFQARAAFEARRRLIALANEGRAPPVGTVSCAAHTAPSAPVGVRSAGIRNVLLRPDRSAATRSETWPNGVVRFFGGTLLTPWSAVVPRSDRGSNRLFYLSARTFAGVSEADLRLWASRLVAGFFEAELAGEMALMPVADLQLRDDFRFTRLVALRLLSDGSARMQRFAGQLARQGLPLLVETDPAVRGYWVPEPAGGDGGDGGTGLIALADVACTADGRLSLSGPAALPSGVAVVPDAAGQRAVGLDGCAALDLRESRLASPLSPGERLTLGPVQDDLVLSIEAAALGSPVQETALLAAVEALVQDGVTRFVSLDRMANALLSHDPIERRFRRTRAATLKPPAAPVSLGIDEVDALMDDARLAWKFFEAFTDKTTGLCPATANVHTGGDALTWVTMWDVGSQINALVAANRLGLIDAEALAGSARQILDQIVGGRAQGRLLPNGVIRTDRNRSGTRDFDGCDAGRLLAALDNLRRHSGLGDEIAARVNAWDLDQILIDGAIHSVKDGTLVSTYASHCAHYAARAFSRWGLKAGSPYRTFDGRTPADGEMALLEAVSQIGPLGAEPLLLEALELGMSPESAYLAEVLHVAQIEEFAETGELVAVSEMPIRRAPWFIYLGLQLGREPREWGIDVVDGVEEYRTKAFLEQNMALSSKAAYLWSAYRPGAYADALVRYVRDRARLPIGFASNVSPSGGGVATSFTDLNTNAIILQAIARKLDGLGRTAPL